MNHLKNTTALLLAMLMLASCGNAGTGSETTADPAETVAAETETEVQEGRQYVKDNLPETMDFEGAALRIYTRGGDEDTRMEFFAEEATGEVVNDAVFERNNTVMERLNVAMEVTYADRNRHSGDQNFIRQTVMGGDDAFEIMADSMSPTMTLGSEGLFQELRSLPWLDFDMPWWNDGFMTTSQMYGKNYLAMGDLSLTMISGTYAMFFNRTLYEEYFPEEDTLFDIVRDGTWTLDTMLDICAGFYQDLNGDGTPNEDDLFGNYYRNQKMLGSDAYVGGCNIQLLTLDESGNIQYNGNGERMMSFLEKLTKLIFENNNTYRGEYNDDTIMVPLIERISLFVPWMLGATTYLRDMEDDFAIIPMPKLDETQAEYSASIHNGASAFAIPVTCQNSEMAAAAMEALCAESYRKVTPAYFDTALKGKYSRDTETAEMLDLLMESINPDMATIFGNRLGAALDMIRGFFASTGENAQAVSKLAASETSFVTKMEEIMESYKELQ
ncbi:MAG: hypothetical protein IJX14_06490 [Clostridia bacterium]|nr:hypothetical protein [Clostridia bacterium]